MLWLEVCQHFQERQQADFFIPLIVWFLQISALLFFYNTKEFGNFFYSRNTFFFFSWQSKSFSRLVLVFLKNNCSWLFILLFFVTSTHAPCPIKIKSDGSCQRSAELGWAIFFLNLQCCCKCKTFFFFYTVPMKTLFEWAKRYKSF